MYYKNSEIFFNNYKAVLQKDEDIILEYFEKEISVRVDKNGKVWTESDIYIADVTPIE